MGTKWATKTRLGVMVCAVCISGLAASAALAGEITGNGKILKNDDGTLNGRSACAYSGQEDLQYLDDAGDPLDVVVKGQPAHAQSWGQIPKAVRDEISLFGFHPGDACNPTIGSPE